MHFFHLVCYLVLMTFFYLGLVYMLEKVMPYSSYPTILFCNFQVELLSFQKNIKVIISMFVGHI